MTAKILTEKGWEPNQPQPGDISLHLPSGEDMLLKPSEWGSASSLIEGISAFLCPIGVTQQSLDILYGKYSQDVTISRQERHGKR